jgi:fructosamine-3-kinase
MDPNVADALAAALGASVRTSRPLSGGDVALAYRVSLDDGRTVFAKTHTDPPPEFFATEAAGLCWLGETGSVAVPAVLAVGTAPGFLALEWIDEGAARQETDVEFGRALARMHRYPAPTFGREDRRPTGSRSLPNEPSPTWAAFYGEQRLRPLARMAQRSGALDGQDRNRLERVADRLDVLGGPPEPPARLHGDLWAGNRLVDRDGLNWLIDPAAHGGHREFDLAMMRLFGGFGAEAFARYGDVFPLADGWEERVLLHQLAPLLVHAIKFGGGYVGAARDAIRRYS